MDEEVKTEIPVEETTVEQKEVVEEKAATVMKVPVDENKEEESAEDLASYKLKDVVNSDDEKVKSIIDKQKEYLLNKAKESDLDWSTVELEEDGLTPKITEEDKAIYAAATDDVFDADTLNVFISTAKQNIDSYLEMKSTIDAGLADEDDLEYFEALSKMSEDAKIVLAMIQKGARDLIKDLNDNKVTESVIKGATLKTIRDFIVSKYKLTGAPDRFDMKEMSKYDRTSDIESRILKNLFPSTMIYESIHRDRVFFTKEPRNYSIFSRNYFENHSQYFIYGLQTYLNAVSKDNPNNIDMTKIIYRDFRVLDFVNPLVTYGLAKLNHPIGVSMKFEQSSLDSMEKVLNPSGIYDTEVKKVVEKVDEVIASFSDPDIIEWNVNNAFDIVIADKTWSTFSEEDKANVDDYQKFISALTGKFPEVDGLRIIPWGKIYSFMEKYQNYADFLSIKKIIEDSEIPVDQKRAKIFVTIMNIAKRFFIWKYADIIDDLYIAIKEAVPKSTRDFMFGAVVNNIALQHNLAFKSEFDPAVNVAGEQLYELAKKTFGNVDYQIMVGDEKNDILLKNVNLVDARRVYWNLTVDILDYINDSLKICKI